jgi:hypothetical protein
MPEKSPIVGVAKKVCPAVISIIISKDLPKVEGFYLLPFGGQNFVMPKSERAERELKLAGVRGLLFLRTAMF